MKHLLKLAGGLLLLTSTSVSLLAQPGGMGQGPQVDVMMSKFFGDVKAFTATGEMSVKGGKKAVTMPMEWAMLDEKLRVSMDMSAMGGEEGMAQMKMMGMDKMVMVIDSAKKQQMMIMPNLKAYADMPIPKEQADRLAKEPKIEKIEMGKETVEGHPCVKYKYIITPDNGKKEETLVWAATDLKNFPIKLEMQHGGEKSSYVYKNIKLEKPDASLFVAPSDFTKYGSMQEMMMSAAMKMMGR
jgi:hypothetical protein